MIWLCSRYWRNFFRLSKTMSSSIGGSWSLCWASPPWCSTSLNRMNFASWLTSSARCDWLTYCLATGALVGFGLGVGLGKCTRWLKLCVKLGVKDSFWFFDGPRSVPSRLSVINDGYPCYFNRLSCNLSTKLSFTPVVLCTLLKFGLLFFVLSLDSLRCWCFCF